MVAETLINQRDLRDYGMTIDSDRVLTASASDYVAARGTTISSYDLHGLHKELYVSDVRVGETIQEQFASTVPDDVEAVVDFRPTSGEGRGRLLYLVSATALVPKPAPRSSGSLSQ